METTVGQVLVNSGLPKEWQDYGRKLDGTSVEEFFQAVAEKSPEKYVDILKHMSDVGRKVATSTGGYAFDTNDLMPTPSALRRRREIETQVAGILDDIRLTPKERAAQIVDVLRGHQSDAAKEIFAEALANKNPFARQIASGARGKPDNLKSLLGGDYLYDDHRGNPVPIPVLRSYAEGLSPAEYWAASYGARKSVTDVKLGVARAGYGGKKLVQVMHRLLTVADDADNDQYDVQNPRGFPTTTDDNSNVGALLAHPAGDYARNTILTKQVLDDLRRKKIVDILVRSPTVGGPASGVYAKDVGVRERGRVPPIGDYVGIAAAQSVGEKLTQLSLCLAAGTLVRMADGTTKKIETIVVGDRVLGANTFGQTFPVSVSSVFDNGERECVTTWFVDVENSVVASVKSTLDHKVLATIIYDVAAPEPLAQRPIRKPKTGTLAAVVVGRGPALSTVSVVGMSGQGDVEVCRTYDIEVDHVDHAFVLANGIVSSNSSKHAGGVARGNNMVTGFPAVEQLLESFETFKAGAAHAQQDGTVERVVNAPQGGKEIYIGGKVHYVPVGFAVRVKTGDSVEAGDILSDGMPNPAEIVRHKGIGEGRRYFTNIFLDTLRNSGLSANRRNIELLARGLVDHVRLDEEMGDFIQDDIVSYQAIESAWKPRHGAQKLPIAAAKGMFLESPVLHYTVGTPLKPSVLQQLKRYNVPYVTAHASPPPFVPQMTPARNFLEHDPDWATRHLGSKLQKTTLKGVARGDASDPKGTSFVPALALDPVNFGRQGQTAGWKPEQLEGQG